VPIDPLMVAQRWDFYDLKDPKLLAIRDVQPDFKGAAWGSAKDHTVPWALYLVNYKGKETRMPPPPATPLSDRDLETIKNWNPIDRGTRASNHRPTAAWLARPSTIVVSDDDHEQVLGKVSCGMADAPVLNSGTTTLPQGWMPPCTATLFDGQDVVTVELP
jgi:hypothetical protein